MKVSIINSIAVTVVTILLFNQCSILEGTPRESNTTEMIEQLCGTWNFVEMRDYKGRKIDSYQESFGRVKATGPQIILSEDMSYQKVFFANRSDTGFWRFDIKTMTIHYQLFIDSTTWVGKDLIEKGLAQKLSDGNYYEEIKEQVKELKDSTMILQKRGGQYVYQKESR